MTKKIRLWLAALASLFILINIPVQVSAYEIDTTYNQMRSTLRTNNRFIILHETGTYAPAVNNAIYFNRAWQSSQSYTSFIVGDGGKVYQVSPTGYVQWGAGQYANVNSPVQIELARTTNKAQFEKDYVAYIQLTRDMARKYGIPLTLDTAGNGVKTHKWVTDNFWGDHTDPYGYLASWGISKAKLANDIANGVGGVSANTSGGQLPTQQREPQRNLPSQPKGGYKVESYNVPQITDTVLRVRTSPNTHSTIIRVLPQGYRFNATRIVRNGENVNGYTTWAEVNNQGWVAMAYTTQTKNVVAKPTTNWKVSTSGYYTVKYTTNIRTAPSTSASIVSTYTTGQGFYFDGYVNANGYKWLTYISYSGQRRYVAKVD